MFHLMILALQWIIAMSISYKAREANRCPCRHTISCVLEYISMPGDFSSQHATRELFQTDHGSEELVFACEVRKVSGLGMNG